MSLTETEYNENFKRCDNCKNPYFRIVKKHIVRKDTHRIMDSEEILVCTKCGKEFPRNQN